MNEPFALGLSWQLFSCVCLSGLLLLEWIALRTLLHETLLLRHLYEPPASPEDALLTVRVQPFRAALMDCLTEADLLGRVTTLLFVRPDRLFAQSKEVLAPLLHSLWTKRQGPLYVICSGSLEDCEVLRDRYRLGRKHDSSVDIVHDETGALRTTFSVTPAIAAVVIGEDGTLSKVGGVHSDEFEEIAPGVAR
jgi:hypothetical protein